MKVVLEPPRKLRKVTLIIEARGACLERESRLEASLHHTDNSGKEGLKQSLSLGATRYFILTIHSSFTVYSMLIHCLFTVYSLFIHSCSLTRQKIQLIARRVLELGQGDLVWEVTYFFQSLLSVQNVALDHPPSKVHESFNPAVVQ